MIARVRWLCASSTLFVRRSVSLGARARELAFRHAGHVGIPLNRTYVSVQCLRWTRGGARSDARRVVVKASLRWVRVRLVERGGSWPIGAPGSP